jgi:hypothetical protein
MSKFRSDFYDEANSSYGHRFLLQLLQFRRGLGVTDPRDMLFAHTIIARTADVAERYREFVKVDYGQDCAEVFRRIARYFVNHFNSLSILSSVEDVELEHRRPGMVSWAPDWTVMQRPLPWTTLEGLGSSRESYLFQRKGVSEEHISRNWTVPSERTLAWSGSTIACIGTSHGVISHLGQEVAWPLSYFNITNFMEENT